MTFQQWLVGASIAGLIGMLSAAGAMLMLYKLTERRGRLQRRKHVSLCHLEGCNEVRAIGGPYCPVHESSLLNGANNEQD